MRGSSHGARQKSSLQEHRDTSGATQAPEAKRDKGRGRGNTLILAKQSALCVFCGVGGKAGKQLEGIPTNTDMSRREGLCSTAPLSLGITTCYHHFSYAGKCPQGLSLGARKYRAIPQLPQVLWEGEKYTNQAKVRVQSRVFSQYLFSWSPRLALEWKRQENKVTNQDERPQNLPELPEQRMFICGGLGLVNKGITML